MRPNRSSPCTCVAAGAASLVLAGCLGSPEEAGGPGEALEASSGAVMARPIGDIEATYDPTANLPPFVQCDSSPTSWTSTTVSSTRRPPCEPGTT